MRDSKTINVVDVEATCWGDGDSSRSEIIEIGVCELRLDDWKIVNPRSLYVRPQRVPGLSEYCTTLTGITQETVDKAGTLGDAFEVLKKVYKSRNRQWASYGQYDATIIRRDGESKGLAYPFGGFHINVKALVEALLVGKEGLKSACERLGLVWEGRQHSGVDDAVMVAKLLAHVLLTARGGLKGWRTTPPSASG